MRLLESPGSVLLLVVVVTAAAACSDKRNSQASSTSTSRTQSSEGTLVFSDDFEDGQLGPEWKRGQGEGGKGQWQIEDGAVVGVDLHNDPLWLDKKLPEKVRIEFDAEAMSSIGDIKVEVFGDGVKHESGYILLFGGWKNTLDVIARLDEHGEDRKSRKTHGVLPGYSYRMAVERTDGTLRWYVNGEHFMSYVDKEPLVGEGHRHFAFNVWSAPVRFDNVAIYDLSQ